MECVVVHTLCITRGSTMVYPCALNDGWTEVLEDPEDYSFRLVLRDYQDDALTPRLELTATVEVVEPAPIHHNDPHLYFTFNASADETAALPSWPLVGYVELRADNDSVVERLFDLEVTIKD